MEQLSVYFDGACPLCSREIAHYQRHPEAHRLRFVDIAAPGFDAAAEGLDAARVHKEMHVKTAAGEVLTAVPAFAAIWRALGGRGYQLLARLTEAPLLRPALAAGYRLFAFARPYLPRRKDPCATGACPV